MRLPYFSGILLVTLGRTLAAADSFDQAAAQQAIQTSVDWLETDMQKWRNDHGCAACHHGPMYLWSINVAKRQGYDVHEPQLQELTQWLLTDDKARIFPKPAKVTLDLAASAVASDRMTAAMMGHRNLSQPTLYLTHALNALPDREPLKKTGWRKVIDHLTAAQNEDGSFVGRNAWRPIFNTPQILTLFSVAGIQDARSLSRDALPDHHEQVLTRARAYLATQDPDATHQGLVLRILSEPQPDGPVVSEGLAAIVHQLTQSQRSDGGWSQTEDRESDAFATGQTLVALHRAGVSSTHPAIRQGVAFLLRTQKPDGTWPMKSRPNPETGQPADFLNPITYAATAWATLGLSTYLPK